MINPAEPFERKETADLPGIVGAKWWHEGLVHEEVSSRRTMIMALLGVAGVGVAGAFAIHAATKDDIRYEARASLEMQKNYGWNFGATDERLTFTPSGAPFSTADLAAIQGALRPTDPAYAPYHVETLFQSTLAKPLLSLPAESLPPHPVGDELRDSLSDTMTVQRGRGGALGELFSFGPKHVAVIVDLPGDEAIAFAAGASFAMTPIFGIDNWPHPRGVVPAHRTLSAALVYRPDFARGQALRQHLSAPSPMFVLDRNRLSTYVDATTQFDNRHLARLPTAANLKSLGIKYVLYICPTSTDIGELDDVNEPLVSYASLGLTVRALGATAFLSSPRPTSAPGPTILTAGAVAPVASAPLGPLYFYGGSAVTSEAFWSDYPWSDGPVAAMAASGVSPAGRTFVPKLRSTPFSVSGAARPPSTPAGFATVPVALAISTGVLLGAQWSRSGSWNRSSSGSSGSWGGG